MANGRIALFRLKTADGGVIGVASDPPPKPPKVAGEQDVPVMDLPQIPDANGNFEIIIRQLGQTGDLPEVGISFLNAELTLEADWNLYAAVSTVCDQAFTANAAADDSDPPPKPPKAALAADSDPPVKPPKTPSGESAG